MSDCTLYLDPDDWDIALDASGSLKLAGGAYAIAQNVANAIRLFTNDAYYYPQRGLPHFALDLGQTDRKLTLLRASLIEAALDVEGVAAATIIGLAVNPVTRAATGTIRITTSEGESADVAL